MTIDVKDIKRMLRLVPVAALVGLTGYSCAHPGSPSGGARDETPPKYVRSSVPLGATNVNAKKITITFDEYINIKDPFNSVVISPTSATTPRVSSLGKNVTVQFEDTLMANTTYTIDFGNSIEDNNEGNKLGNYAFWFSTGEEIDSLRISGMVLGARDLEPQQGMLVGVYRSEAMADSTFKTVRLERVAKTDDRGRFILRGLKAGKYKLRALGDLNNDYKWNRTEDLAFLDIDVEPGCERVETTDTIYDMKSGEVDTVQTRTRTRYLPNDILLRSFNTDYKSQYLTAYERVDSTRLKFTFNTRQPELPELSMADGSDLEGRYLLERTRHNDTLTYWLRDTELIHRDTLMIAARYLRTDSTDNLSWVSDTIRFLTKHPKDGKKKKKKDEESHNVTPAPVKPLAVSVLTGASHEVYNPLILQYETPLHGMDTTLFRLLEQVDTTWVAVKKHWGIAPLDSMTLTRGRIDYPWEYGQRYRLEADSAAVCGIYGNYSSPLKHEFTVKKQEDYCNLQFEITGLPTGTAAFVELLNTSDTPTLTAPVENGVATFLNLGTGMAYARVVIDSNGDGEYTPGNYESGLQPDVVYYYPKRLTLKANWDMVQTWDVFGTAVNEQKPETLKKNKSETDKKRRSKSTTDEDEDEEEDEGFDVNRNPFDPNSGNKQRRY